MLFVGTKKQAQEAIAEQATRVGMPYVNERWLGGMLTNFQTVFKRLQRLKELEAMEQGGWDGTATKKEQLMLTREKDKLERTLGGIREMSRVPSAVWIVDTKKEHIAVERGPQAGHPGDRDPRHQLRPGRGRLQDPGQRRRDPQRRPADPGRSPTRSPRAWSPAPPPRRTPAATRSRTPGQLAADEPLPEWERDLLQPAGTAEAAATPAPAAEAPR